MRLLSSNIIALAMILCFTITSTAQVDQDETHSKTNISDQPSSSRRLNFYVVNKPKTLDLFSRMVIWRARKKGMTRRHKFIVIVARSSEEVKNKIVDYLQKEDAMIASLWFDTHGHYANGYSSFIIGKDEFSYKTINDTAHTKHLHALASFCDEYTRVAIGSCYGGATFEKPVHNGHPATRMNGDSLMFGLANVLPNTTIYATEGWVMTKPGIFQKHSYALAGYPLQKRFKDEVYRPVWENMGIWHSYSTTTQKFETINTLSLTRMGSIHIKDVSYLEKEKSRKKLEKNLRKLRPGVLKT